jgi:hypothetical protein
MPKAIVAVVFFFHDHPVSLDRACFMSFDQTPTSFGNRSEFIALKGRTLLG